MAAPKVTIAHFHRAHDLVNPDDAPPSLLHHSGNTPSLGFFRGENLAVGHKVHIENTAKTKTWDGTITEMASEDRWTQRYGFAWFFSVLNTKYPTIDSPSFQDNTITVTVTVTNPGTGESCPGMTPSPNPSDVP
jgi:hypothetical protein